MIKSLAWIAVASFVLSGCGESGKQAATQVVARVDNGEISVHQLNAVLARTPGLTPEQAKVVGRQILDKLVNQEVLVQQALAAKLDREPKTMQAIEAARREILARAFVDKIAAGVPKPSAEDIKTYFNQHPELFAERRIYNFNEVVAKLPPDSLPLLEEQLKKAGSLADIIAWLKSRDIAFAVNTSTKAAEQLPMELLPRFHQMKNGQIGVIPTKDAVLISQLAGSKTVPMDEKNAEPFIKQFLFNKVSSEAVEKEIKALRAKAKIEYLGDFAKVPAPAEVAKPVEDKPAATSTPTVIDRGLSGLK
jgi:EpsD family peptidyl-prolyl cis-trans isomerase